MIARGNPNVILCERGIRTYEEYVRNTLALAAVPELHRVSPPAGRDRPVSQGTGKSAPGRPPCAGRPWRPGPTGLIVEVPPRPRARDDRRGPERHAGRVRRHDAGDPADRGPPSTGRSVNVAGRERRSSSGTAHDSKPVRPGRSMPSRRVPDGGSRACRKPESTCRPRSRPPACGCGCRGFGGHGPVGHAARAGGPRYGGPCKPWLPWSRATSYGRPADGAAVEAGGRRASSCVRQKLELPASGPARRYVGVVGLGNPRRDRAGLFDVGYWLATPFVGRGCMTEWRSGRTSGSRSASSQTGRAGIGPDPKCEAANGRSRRVAERCGYALDGTLRRLGPP